MLILDVDKRAGIATAALVTNIIEAATDHDAFLDGHEADIPYPILVEADVIGPLWVNQLVERVGRVPSELAAAVLATGNSNYHELTDSRRGIPLQWPDDWRVRFKQEEIIALHRLTRSCAAFLEDGLISICDPHFLQPDHASDDDCLALFRIISERPIEVGSEVSWQLIQDPDYPDAWVRRFGWDGWQAVHMLLRPAAPIRAADPVAATTMTPRPTSHRDAALLALQGYELMRRGVHTVTMPTRAGHWESSVLEDRGYCSLMLGDANLHVACELVEG